METTPKKRGPKPVPAPAGRDVEAEWQHLRTWYAATADPVRPWNLGAIGERVGLVKQQVKALLDPGPVPTRTAATVVRLHNFQALFAATPYNYQPATNDYLFS